MSKKDFIALADAFRQSKPKSGNVDKEIQWGSDVLSVAMISNPLPRYLYHGSPKIHSEDNLKNGLRKQHSMSHNEWDGGAIYLALDAEAAAMYPDHWETGESQYGGIVYRVETKYLNKNLLRPDDADFPDMFAQLTDEEKADLAERFGDDFNEDSWVYCEWPVSLYLTGQVSYLGDIPAEALSIDKTASLEVENG